MAILKKPYELSIWEEELNSSGVKTERKSYIIGAHDMQYLGRATKLKLKKEIKGTNTLTFEMPTKFFDSKSGEYVKNEFIDLLFNEQKIKLQYKGIWYEFFIKKIQEKKNFKSIVKEFTCQDSFIDELSRTGYGITFKEELYNNVEEIGTFMKNDDKINGILNGSIWNYTPKFNYGDFTEYSEERFYKIPLSQFGGKLDVYKIDMALSIENFPQGIEIEDLTIENIYTGEKRICTLSDDLSREYEVFWDVYYNKNSNEQLGNGKGLLRTETVELTGDYIYVPITDLSYIYGTVYEDVTTVTETPALYGNYQTKEKIGYALQPKSSNPKGFIQLLFFEDNDIIEIDEVGNISNNDYHYIIPIEQWNAILKKQLENITSGLIYWEEEYSDITLKEVYNPIIIDNKVYPQNLTPSTSIIDNFNWYPVYYEGYLNEIMGVEVYKARKISIANRTEYNKKADSFVKVYNNYYTEFKNDYNGELGKLIENDASLPDFRVCSISENQIVVPTLARNYIQNGIKISDTAGWEGLTKKSITDNNISSLENLLSCEIKSVNPEKDTNIDGESSDENIGDFFLEVSSPYITNSDDLSLEGNVYTDWLLNFGLVGQEKIIEKNKIYAIRICTGEWTITSRDLSLRNKNIDDADTMAYIVKDVTEEDIALYKNLLVEYVDMLNDNSEKYNFYKFLKEKHETLTEDEIKTTLLDFIKENFGDVPAHQSFLGCYDMDDYLIIKNHLLDETSIIEPSVLEEWQKDLVYEHKLFNKEYNQQLDKILIGQGSVDVNGNYLLSGTKDTDNKENYISFKNLFEPLSKDEINYVVQDIQAKEKHTFLYHNKEDGIWYWSKESDNGIIDYPYLLFKANTTINNPYIGLEISSEPAEVKISDLTVKLFSNTNYSGLKLEAWCENNDKQKVLAEGVSFKIYIINEDNFNTDFIERVNNGDYTFNIGDLLNNVKPIWNGITSSKKTLYFTQIQPKNNEGTLDYNETEKYALFGGQKDKEDFYGVFSFKKVRNIEENGNADNENSDSEKKEDDNK